MKGVALVLLVVAAVAQGSSVQEESPYEPDGGKFLIGVRRTNIITTLSTSTVAVGATCYAKINTGTCTGKRKRRALKDSIKISDDSTDGLESSQTGETAAILDPAGNQEKLVIWTTSTTTITWFSSSTTSGTTLTVNYSCTASGVSFPPLCG